MWRGRWRGGKLCESHAKEHYGTALNKVRIGRRWRSLDTFLMIRNNYKSLLEVSRTVVKSIFEHTITRQASAALIELPLVCMVLILIDKSMEWFCGL